MRSPNTDTLPIELSRELTLTRANTDADLRAIVDAHTDSFGDEDKEAFLANLCHRPGSVPQDVFYVMDTRTRQPVSSVSLIEETWMYEGIPFKVAEVGIVSTVKSYRKRGLIREQLRQYHRLARQKGCLVSAINGIPHFYRQFGYEYVTPMGRGWSLAADKVPDLEADQSTPYSIRPARSGDMAALHKLYSRSIESLCVASDLPREIWLYQDSLPQTCGDLLATYVVERDGHVTGYFRTFAHEHPEWRKGVTITAAYLPQREACLAILRYLKRIAEKERQSQTIAIHMPIDLPLAQVARDLGAEFRSPYAWQLRILDPVRFLWTIGPALERRLSASSWASLTRSFVMGLHDNAMALRFDGGRLTNVASLTNASHRDLTCPPGPAAMIWFGARGVDRVVDWYGDVGCRDKTSQRLASILFPERESWVGSLF